MKKNCRVMQLEPTKESVKEIYDLLGISYDEVELGMLISQGKIVCQEEL